MSEMDMFMKSIPQISEMVGILRNLSKEQREEWKNEILTCVDERVKNSIGKLIVIMEEIIRD